MITSAVSTTRVRVTPSQGVNLRFLDGLRGLAALYVMIHHCWWLLWRGYSEEFKVAYHHYALLGKASLFIAKFFGYGHEAVLFFFILSGFVIHFRYAKALANNSDTASFDWSSYVYRRARRIYPPLIFSMILTYVLDKVGISAGFPNYFTVASHQLIPRHDFLTALGNLTFVMGTYASIWGSNSPLWSLNYEWWFYMLYPIFWRITKRSILLATVVMVLGFLLSLCSFSSVVKLLQHTFNYMLLWWFGVLLADIYTGRIKQGSFKNVGWLSCFFVMLPFRHFPTGLLHDYFVGLAFTGLLALCFSWKISGKSLTILEKLKPLGDMSYTLYVVNLPIITFISGWLLKSSKTHTLPDSIEWVFLGMLVSFAFAYFAHFLIEKPFTSENRKPLSGGAKAF